jgi:hypothetical protein
MTEETQTTDQGETEVTETLDDIISNYDVPAPRREEPEQPRESYQETAYKQVPNFDPMDENSVKQFQEYVNNSNTALSSQMREMREKLTRYEQHEAELRIETDINEAVKSVNDGLDLNPKLIRTHLELTAQEKPQFKKIWENRHDDQKTYKRALKALQKEISDTYKVRQDPELTETQTAIQQSQKSMASTSQKKEGSLDEALAGAKSQAEFDRIWRQAIGR